MTPQTTTVAQLRKLLQESSVHVPSKARKADLVELVEAYNLAGKAAPEPTSDDEVPLSKQLSGLSMERSKDASSASATREPAHEAQAALPNIPSRHNRDDVSYLAAGFDPASLRVPKLRNILATHNVSYGQVKTKADLVRLFKSHIVPRAAATLRAMEKVERTDEGIVDA